MTEQQQLDYLTNKIKDFATWRQNEEQAIIISWEDDLKPMLEAIGELKKEHQFNVCFTVESKAPFDLISNGDVIQAMRSRIEALAIRLDPNKPYDDLVFEYMYTEGE